MATNNQKKISKPNKTRKPVKKIQFTQSGEIGAFIEDKRNEFGVSEAQMVRIIFHRGIEAMFDAKVVGNKLILR